MGHSPHGVVWHCRREEGEELVLRVRHGHALVRLEAHVALRRRVAQLHVSHVRRHQVCEEHDVENNEYDSFGVDRMRH